MVYPVHPNPNVCETAYRVLGHHSRITLCEPLDYLPFVAAMKQAFLILSDSGGVQEEAPALGKPVLVLRNETERPEAVAEGVVKLVGADYDRIVGEAQHLLDDGAAYRRMARGVSPMATAGQRAALPQFCTTISPHASDLSFAGSLAQFFFSGHTNSSDIFMRALTAGFSGLSLIQAVSPRCPIL